MRGKGKKSGGRRGVGGTPPASGRRIRDPERLNKILHPILGTLL